MKQKKPIVEYYVDQSMKSRYPVNPLGKPIIEWGESLPGTTKKREIYVRNATNDRIVMRQPHTSDPDLFIKDFPTSLNRGEIAKVVLEFAPALERDTPLRADWGFELVIG